MRFDLETHTLYVGERAWQADPRDTNISELRFGTTTDFVHRDRRCRIRFESGWSASIIWGSGTYSSNHDSWLVADQFTEEPTTVEVGVCDSAGALRQRRIISEGGAEYTDVESYCDELDLNALLDRLATLPTDFDYGAPPPPLEDVIEAMQKLNEDLGLGLPAPPEPFA